MTEEIPGGLPLPLMTTEEVLKMRADPPPVDILFRWVQDERIPLDLAVELAEAAATLIRGWHAMLRMSWVVNDPTRDIDAKAKACSVANDLLLKAGAQYEIARGKVECLISSLERQAREEP